MPHRILFLCTGNSARSILAEATLRAWGAPRFEAFSAGSHPAGQVNPAALSQLRASGISAAGLHSKSWDLFAAADAPVLDAVVTVCDAAAAEACPVVFGDFVRTHWGQPDPAAVGEAGRAAAFEHAHAIVGERIRALLAVPDAAWDDPLALKAALDAIAALPGGERAVR